MCECCGCDVPIRWVEVTWSESEQPLCAVCCAGIMQAVHDLPASHQELALAFARIANAYIDASGQHFREALETRLLGGEAPQGTYDSL